MLVNQASDSGPEGGRLDKQDGAAADWQAAGGRGADCDPKDVARMVEGYVIKKEKGREREITRTPHHHSRTLESVVSTAHPKLWSG